MSHAVSVWESLGRGRALRAARDIAAGEVVLSDLPLLLTPSHDAVADVCSACLRLLPAKGTRLSWRRLATVWLRRVCSRASEQGCVAQVRGSVLTAEPHAFAQVPVRSGLLAMPLAILQLFAGRTQPVLPLPDCQCRNALHYVAHSMQQQDCPVLCDWTLVFAAACNCSMLLRPGAALLSMLALSSSALACLDFSGLSGDACSSLRYLAQVNALRTAAAAGNSDAAARCAALGGLAAGLPAPAEAGELYRRLAAATGHAGGPCTLLVPCDSCA